MNNGRYTLCPYYMSEHGKSIRCEDTLRTFRWKPQKDRWMDSFCDSNWQECRFAIEISKAYEGSDEDLEEQKIKALETEIRALTSKLGRAEKRCAAKDEDIRKARNNRDKWERAYQRKAKECAEARREIERLEGINTLFLTQLEPRFAYLLYKLGNNIADAEIEEWIKSNEFMLDNEKDERGHIVTWRVKVNG